MNYPPKNIPEEEVMRFWGEPRKKDRDLLKNIKVREKEKMNQL